MNGHIGDINLTYYNTNYTFHLYDFYGHLREMIFYNENEGSALMEYNLRALINVNGTDSYERAKVVVSV
jgi:hypothetical protein